MLQKIIGRKEEQKTLQDCYESNKPEFVAVYGRRRIGKTFLVKQFFKEKLLPPIWSISSIAVSCSEKPLIPARLCTSPSLRLRSGKKCPIRHDTERDYNG